MNEKKNAFQQLVDHNLSGLQWDERRTQKVLHALEPEGGTIVKKKFSMGFALVTALVLMASVALAVVSVVYSPSMSAANQARQVIIEKYGLTHMTLGLFSYDMQMLPDKDVYMFHTFLDSDAENEAIGEYTVTVPNDGEITVSWTHDDKDPTLWESGDLTAPVWGQPQLETYLLQQAEADVVYEIEMAASTPEPVADDSIVRVVIREVEPGPNDLSREEALAIANAALMETFQLTEEDMARLILTHCGLMQVDDYASRWWEIDFNYPLGNVMQLPHVMIDAATGEVTDVSMQTLAH